MPKCPPPSGPVMGLWRRPMSACVDSSVVVFQDNWGKSTLDIIDGLTGDRHTAMCGQSLSHSTLQSWPVLLMALLHLACHEAAQMWASDYWDSSPYLQAPLDIGA
ncbi:hypothetical protein GDO81_018439 [Engystomops pustulosus]|uniref:Uncharacterized protein n=1 Tax=Engystomops pustulosus TaxID=76066 RepID=A0AAV6ZWN9_ENGPU|nr:hypothetical protein GDO81_018439 [Engystomops pustulosus]